MYIPYTQQSYMQRGLAYYLSVAWRTLQILLVGCWTTKLIPFLHTPRPLNDHKISPCSKFSKYFKINEIFYFKLVWTCSDLIAFKFHLNFFLNLVTFIQKSLYTNRTMYVCTYDERLLYTVQFSIIGKTIIILYTSHVIMYRTRYAFCTIYFSHSDDNETIEFPISNHRNLIFTSATTDGDNFPQASY